MFCPTCGSLLMPKIVKNQKIIACSCGYSQHGEAGVVKEVVKKKSGINELVIESHHNQRLPLTTTECAKCGHTKAFFWTKQTRAGDEPETKFLKCEKCNHTWRDYI